MERTMIRDLRLKLPAAAIGGALLLGVTGLAPAAALASTNPPTVDTLPQYQSGYSYPYGGLSASSSGYSYPTASQYQGAYGYPYGGYGGYGGFSSGYGYPSSY